MQRCLIACTLFLCCYSWFIVFLSGQTIQLASLHTSHSHAKLLLFMAPGPSITNVERRAINSWMHALNGTGQLIFLVADISVIPSLEALRLCWVRIEGTYDGFALWDAMVSYVHHALHTGVVGITNTDIFVSAPSFHRMLRALRTIRFERIKRYKSQLGSFITRGGATKEWLAVGTRYDIEGKTRMVPHRRGGYDIWLWNVFPGCGLPVNVTQPPFRFGRPIFDNWFLDIALRRGDRHVIDVSSTLLLLHHAHKHKINTTEFGDWEQQKSISSANVYINEWLGFWINGSMSMHLNGLGSPCEAPYMLASCMETTVCLEHRESRVPCASWIPRSYMEHKPNATSIMHIRSASRRHAIAVQFLPASDSSIESWNHLAYRQWPHTSELIATRKASTVVRFSFTQRMLASNARCNLEHAAIKTYAFEASDDNGYKWGVGRGLPVFREENVSFDTGFDMYSIPWLLDLKGFCVFAQQKSCSKVTH